MVRRRQIAKVVPERIEVTHDGMRVHCQMPQLEGKVYQFRLNGMQSRSGRPLTNPIGWYTLNKRRLSDLR